MTRLVAWQHERVSGGSPGRLRIHRRVPGLPCDGMLTGEEEAAIAAAGQHMRKGRRR